LAYERDVVLPRRMLMLAELRGILTEFQTKGAEQKRISTDLLFGVENTLKAFRGRFEALVDPAIIAAKERAEAAIRARVAADPQLAPAAGAWDAIAASVVTQRGLYDRYDMLEKAPDRGAGSRLFRIARNLVRYAAEREKPDEKRLPEF